MNTIEGLAREIADCATFQGKLSQWEPPAEEMNFERGLWEGAMSQSSADISLALVTIGEGDPIKIIAMIKVLGTLKAALAATLSYFLKTAEAEQPRIVTV